MLDRMLYIVQSNSNETSISYHKIKIIQAEICWIWSRYHWPITLLTVYGTLKLKRVWFWIESASIPNQNSEEREKLGFGIWDKIPTKIKHFQDVKTGSRNLECHCRGAIFNSLRSPWEAHLVLGFRNLVSCRFRERWPRREGFSIHGCRVQSSQLIPWTPDSSFQGFRLRLLRCLALEHRRLAHSPGLSPGGRQGGHWNRQIIRHQNICQCIF